RETAKRLRAGEDGVKVLDREIQCLSRRVWLANRRYVDHLQCDRTTCEVAARTRLFSRLEPEQLAVKGRGLVEVSHPEFDAKQTRCLTNHAFLRPPRRRFFRPLVLVREPFHDGAVLSHCGA